jgi:uncharacterized protein YcaQ
MPGVGLNLGYAPMRQYQRDLLRTALVQDGGNLIVALYHALALVDVDLHRYFVVRPQMRARYRGQPNESNKEAAKELGAFFAQVVFRIVDDYCLAAVEQLAKWDVGGWAGEDRPQIVV